jgi:hypothetical protein
MLALWSETVKAVYRRISNDFNFFVPFDRLPFPDNTV